MEYLSDQWHGASTSPGKTAMSKAATTARKASPERLRRCTNTLHRQHLNNHTSGPFQTEDGACKRRYLIHLLVRLSIQGLCSSVHNCGRNQCSSESPGMLHLCIQIRYCLSPPLARGEAPTTTAAAAVVKWNDEWTTTNLH